MSVERVYLIRHGETEWNTTGRWQGVLQVPLNDTGREQGQKLARALQHEGVQAVYTSDLSRALDTAQMICDRLDIEPQIDLRLRELDIGVFQGLTVAEITARYPQEYADFMAQPMTYPLPQGESRQQLEARVMECWREVISLPNLERVAIVTHGGVIKMLLSALWSGQAEAFQSYEIPNTSVTTLTLTHGTWEISDLASIAHLGRTETTEQDSGVYF